MNRRNFIKKTTLASSGLWLAPNLNKPDFQIPAGFSPKILATNWGFSGSWEAFAAKAKEAGYDGAEVWVPGDEKGRTYVQVIEDHKKVMRTAIQKILSPADQQRLTAIHADWAEFELGEDDPWTELYVSRMTKKK